MSAGGSGITEPLYQWVRENLPAGRRILELGSGDTSTPIFCRHYGMTSVEHDPQWLNRHPTYYVYAPLVDGWYSPAVLRDLLPHAYDLILVDGPVGSLARVGFLKHLHLFRLDVPIIVDDTWRMCEFAMARTLGRLLGGPVLHRQQFAVVLPS